MLPPLLLVPSLVSVPSPEVCVKAGSQGSGWIYGNGYTGFLMRVKMCDGKFVLEDVYI